MSIIIKEKDGTLTRLNDHDPKDRERMEKAYQKMGAQSNLSSLKYGSAGLAFCTFVEAAMLTGYSSLKSGADVAIVSAAIVPLALFSGKVIKDAIDNTKKDMDKPTVKGAIAKILRDSQMSL